MLTCVGHKKSREFGGVFSSQMCADLDMKHMGFPCNKALLPVLGAGKTMILEFLSFVPLGSSVSH